MKDVKHVYCSENEYFHHVTPMIRWTTEFSPQNKNCIGIFKALISLSHQKYLCKLRIVDIAKLPQKVLSRYLEAQYV